MQVTLMHLHEYAMTDQGPIINRMPSVDIIVDSSSGKFTLVELQGKLESEFPLEGQELGTFSHGPVCAVCACPLFYYRMAFTSLLGVRN